MQFTFAHNNFNVLNLEKSLSLYREALHLTEARRNETPDENFILVFLGDGRMQHQLELTWLKDRQAPYNLGDNSSRGKRVSSTSRKNIDFHF
jgi:lactoylglutathione lyase